MSAIRAKGLWTNIHPTLCAISDSMHCNTREISDAPGYSTLSFRYFPLFRAEELHGVKGFPKCDLERKMTHVGLFAAGMAAAHVAGTERQISKEKDISRVINGVSAKRQLLGQKVYNDRGEMVGKIDDLILTKKVVTYAIGKFLRDGNRIVLPDASTACLSFPNVKVSRT